MVDVCRAPACSSSPFTSHTPPVMDQKLTSVLLAITQHPYAVWEEWERLTSFWPSAAPPLLSPSSLAPALTRVRLFSERIRALLSQCLCFIKLSSVCFFSVSIATFPSNKIFPCRIFKHKITRKTAVTSNRALRFYYILVLLSTIYTPPAPTAESEGNLNYWGTASNKKPFMGAEIATCRDLI